MDKDYDVETKKLLIEGLVLKFTELMELIIRIPGADVQKRQALLRFDEGCMWMQNAIASYVAPTEPSASNQECAQMPDVKKTESNEAA
ncbi:MAG TPA: hypothetical protein VNU45_18090 [Rummeliibacillus sp.]|nr:hypothetical protein [Rummeliibacillus sp.]